MGRLYWRMVFSTLVFSTVVFSTALAAESAQAPVRSECPTIEAATAEQFVWQQVCTGQDADFNQAPPYGGRLDPHQPNSLWAKRAISSKFLETILLKEPYRSWLTRRGVVIKGGYFPGDVDLEGADLQHPLLLQAGRFEKNVHLQWISTKTLIDLGGSKVVGAVLIDGVQSDADLNLNDGGDFADVEIEGAHVGGSIDFGSASVSGKLSLIASHIAQGVYLNEGGTFSNLIDASFATIGESLDLSESTFNNNIIKLESAQIGNLYFGSARDKPADPAQAVSWQPATWNGLVMNLHNASADLVPGLSDMWPADVNLSGFSYRSINDPAAPSEGQIKAWLANQGASAQPYEQLALVLQNHGASEEATFARYLGREKARAAASGWHYAWLTMIGWTVGYGYYPWHAIVPALLLVAVGVALLRISRQGPANGMPYGITYSFDMLLPLIRLREKHYNMELDGWVRYYFYLHKIAGWVLASFLVAGISGLTK